MVKPESNSIENLELDSGTAEVDVDIDVDVDVDVCVGVGVDIGVYVGVDVGVDVDRVMSGRIPCNGAIK